MYRILVINPGSTSTKIAVYENLESVITKTIRYEKASFANCKTIYDQKEIRMQSIIQTLSEANISLEDVDAIAARGGLLKPIESGVYTVNSLMLNDLNKDFAKGHASSLGAIMGNDLGKKFDIPCFIVDPVVVDELEPRARLTGFPEIQRTSIFHALNTKYVARKCAGKIGKSYDNSRMVVAHMGGGITVGAHRYGKVIDVNDGLTGDGPFSPERSGSLPVKAVVELCYSGKYSKQDMLDIISKKGGMVAHIGTNDLREAEQMIASDDSRAKAVVEAMAYQITKQIGAMITALDGKADAIILTGGLAYSEKFVDKIRQSVIRLAPVYVYPGENEMEALAEGVYRVLTGSELPKEYR